MEWLKLRNKGFTLIEVLVAVAILAIALLAVTRAVSYAVQQNTYLREKNLAQWVATDVAAQVATGLLNVQDLSGQQSGEKTILNIKFIWHIVVADLPDLPAKQVTITVSDQNEKQSFASVELFINKPVPQLMNLRMPG